MTIVIRLIRMLLLAALLAAVAVPVAGARTWSAKVVEVNDGDTIHVDIDGDATHRAFPVRFIAMQAMEQTVYAPRPARRRGECHSLEATARLEQLLRRGHMRVRLTARRADEIDHKGRLRRFVATRLGGRWQDVGARLIAEGHTLRIPAIDEPRRNALYNRLQQQAALRGRNLWAPEHCGSGPSQDVPLRLWLASDPLGIDERNVNGEWVKIRNLGTRDVSLGGWWVRDSSSPRYRFPAGTTIAAGRTLTLYVGGGADGGSSLFWGMSKPMFENVQGDGAYLFDPQGDLRASMLYPCVVSCTDPNQGALAIEAHPRAPESVRVRNVSNHDVELYGYELALSGSTWAFPEGAALRPGQSMDVDVREWDGGRYMLVDSGGSIRLTTFTEITLACDAWGAGSC